MIKDQFGDKVRIKTWKGGSTCVIEYLKDGHEGLEEIDNLTDENGRKEIKNQLCKNFVAYGHE